MPVPQLFQRILPVSRFGRGDQRARGLEELVGHRIAARKQRPAERLSESLRQ